MDSYAIWQVHLRGLMTHCVECGSQVPGQGYICALNAQPEIALAYLWFTRGHHGSATWPLKRSLSFLCHIRTMSMVIRRSRSRDCVVRLVKMSHRGVCSSLKATAKWWFSSTDSSLYINASSDSETIVIIIIISSSSSGISELTISWNYVIRLLINFKMKIFTIPYQKMTKK